MNWESKAAGGLFYFPTVQWLSNAAITGTVVFNKNERHTKKSQWNRMELAGGEGKITLSIPLKGGRMSKSIYSEMQISREYPWQEQHWKTIVSCYNRSPWFDYYRDSLHALYQVQENSLWQWNLNCLEWLLTKFGIRESISCSEIFEKEGSAQLLDTPTMPHIQSLAYRQVFQDKIGFLAGLSSLDLLFCEGGNARNLLFNKS